MNTVALILAAGSGTRMKSSTPKVAFNLLEKPLICWVIDVAYAAGCAGVITVLGHKREIVEPLVQGNEVVYQDEQLGTGHAVLMAEDKLKRELENGHNHVIILSGDTPLITPETIAKLAQEAEKSQSSAVVLSHVADDPFGYGRIVRDKDKNLIKIVEQKDCNDFEESIRECNSGIYCFEIKSLLSHLSDLSTDNAQGEYLLPDVISLMIDSKEKVSVVEVDDPLEASGINTRVQLAQATKIMQKRINEKHMLAGVTMLDPDLVWIGPDVKIDPDVEILPMTMIMGKSVIESGCTVGPNTRITGSQIGQSSIVDECVIIDSVLDDHVTCGPRAYLRPGVHMRSGSKAGTHVEIKKSTIGKGSKVPHLSYLGDASVGDNVNIGAGSITCNYDGKNKYETSIGDNALIGSDTMMVAPVNIGVGAATGAGSTITEDVPDEALGIARSRQTNIKDYMKRNKSKKDCE